MKSISRVLLTIILACLLASCSASPAEVERNEQPAPGYQAAPEEPINIEPAPEPESEPEPLCPENWPAHFAALVEGIAARWEEDAWAKCPFANITGFHLMDIDSDGTPELLVYISLPIGAGPFVSVLSWDSPLEALDPSLSATMSYGLPLQFFQNDDTGEIIYSSLVFNHGTNSIVYSFSEGLVPFRMVSCRTSNNHFLYERTGIGWVRIKESIVTPEHYGDIADLCDCGIWYGRNSPDPTIVHLVNRALEGFTEIPAPPMYTFDGLADDNLTFFTPEHVGEVQAWIFEVAESWGA